MIEPERLHATLKPIQQLNGTLSAGVPIPGPPGPISQIQDEGVDLTVRPTLNFAGPGVTVTDDAANARTVVTIPGQSPWTQNINGGGFTLSNTSLLTVQNAGIPGGIEIGGASGGAWIWLYDNADLLFAVNNAGSMQLNANGTAYFVNNLGIGKTAPSYKLDCNGDINISAGSVYRIGGSVWNPQTPWTSDINGGGFKVTNVGKGSVFGSPSGSAFSKTDANLLLYDFGGANWAGMGIDVNGSMWFKTGLGGAVGRVQIESDGHFYFGTDTNPQYFHLSPTGLMAVTGNCSISGAQITLTGLPSTNPGAGTKRLWYDPADSNRVKFAA